MQPEAASLLGVHRPLPSALRILARRGDSQILILHGEDRPIQEGERLAQILWLPSIGVAEEVSRFCSGQLIKAQMPPDAEGWHDFAVEHLLTLINLAKTHLNVTIHPPEAAPRERQSWTRERDARLCYKAGEGYTAKAIAEDELIRSTANNVYVRACRLGISISSIRSGQVSIRLPAGTMAALDAAANRAHLTREALARRLLSQAIDQHIAGEQDGSFLQDAL